MTDIKKWKVGREGDGTDRLGETWEPEKLRKGKEQGGKMVRVSQSSKPSLKLQARILEMCQERVRTWRYQTKNILVLTQVRKSGETLLRGREGSKTRGQGTAPERLPWGKPEEPGRGRNRRERAASWEAEQARP